jgi:hypothetical protein
MATKKNTIMALALIFTFVFALGVFLAMNLPKETTPNEETTPPTTSVITVLYNGTQWNYTLAALQELPVTSGSGSYIKLKLLPTVSISGPFNFTGVDVAVLLNRIPNLPSNYSVLSTSNDNYSMTYTYDEIQGNVDVYDLSGNVTGTSGVTMLLAYQQDGQYITDPTVGPLRIVFVDHGAVTSSSLWSKSVVTLEIVR